MVDSNNKRIIICSDCGEEKEYCAKGMCKCCYRRINVARWRRNNPEKSRANSRRYYQRHTENVLSHQRRYRQEHSQEHIARVRRWQRENPEKKRLYDRRYREKNREKLATKNRLWRKENFEKDAATHRRWERENPEKMAIYRGRRRALKNAVANTLTFEQAEFERKIGEAIYPGEKLHLHHIVSLSKGGGHTWGNIAFIPASLNIKIRGKLPEEVYKQLYLFEVAV